MDRQRDAESAKEPISGKGADPIFATTSEKNLSRYVYVIEMFLRCDEATLESRRHFVGRSFRRSVCFISFALFASYPDWEFFFYQMK